MWKVIDFEEQYWDQMIEMIRENYGEIEIAQPEFLKWQYFENPAGKAIIKLAYDVENNRLVGQYVVVPYRMKVGKIETICLNCLDVLTKKQYRGQGIFSVLAKQTNKKCQSIAYPFVMVSRNENSRKDCLKNFNFRPVCRFPILVTLSKRFHMSKESFPNIYPITLNRVSLFNFFWERVQKKYDIIGVRDAAYMKWRYIDIPLRKYFFYGVIRKDVLQGYIVGTIKKIAGIRTGVIVDFLVDDDCETDDVKRLILRVLKDFAKEKARISMAFFPNHSDEYDLLKQNGYVKWPRKLEPRLFEVYAMDFENNHLFNEENGYEREKWYTAIGDYLLG